VAKKTAFAAALVCVSLGACNTAGTSRISSEDTAAGDHAVVKGEPSGNGRIARASWYGPGFHGRKTASGERFNAHALTAAHRTLPFGTRVHVRNTKNGKSVVVRINDRGPFHRGREIDLSHGAARAIGMGGIGTVTMVVLGEKRG
jgi:rare lipoprotein A